MRRRSAGSNAASDRPQRAVIDPDILHQMDNWITEYRIHPHEDRQPFSEGDDDARRLAVIRGRLIESMSSLPSTKRRNRHRDHCERDSRRDWRGFDPKGICSLDEVNQMLGS